ncbi:flagellar basal-body MS-ring/collar protein FliF [Paracoccus denitrificans]|uniref:flagellar basal-body MS-ring/collar protein FliF n=1 Tax=Paracoccus denitrificans TaxID=266 RepID=UPI000FECA754|nr:flagellar basal-body MS-ring/collar protein FliF [Paracoccus denitrificans]MBB4628907.1 flagellar M-ring protein FliF [Paracoccus denitrificans]MCU7429972.1 flagellar basal-body MS-ring/collar protein FliF [Paracoccus denitrificans]QAR26059.1 flagellar M-ring protein FliF [Paracoccus denitrificans]UPV94973.1 flagellar M-ring protein FliF [Paracoccus denitrificans]WQO32973.1 flagellar basal-body MS-ring/collar protein FliF [Paracoccus denitrificans]
MLKLQDYWRDRSTKQRAMLAAAFLFTFAAIAGLSWMASRPGMALLYSGLDPQQSGAVMAAVEKSGVPYEIRGDSIWVAESRRDELRMTLAGEGLPSAGGSGYEILDGMSGFGTTSQMFDAAYWRAKEGELARTILALPNVKAARVHLAVPQGRGYRREAEATASVTLTTDGTPISRNQAKALKFLVSSGVPGMTADRVAVIDSERGVISSGEDFDGEDREAEMKRNVERILAAHVGHGNAIVELHLDVVNESELLTEQRFDPQERALISQESEESADQSSNAQQGAVTAASNLPEGQDSAGDQSRSSRSETRQRSNFEVSKITREVTRQPGATRRLTVAVLVNGVARTEANGEATLVPREETELQAIRELVASAVGFDEGRGDAITVKSLPFASLSQAGTLASAGGFLSRLDLNGLIRIALVGFFALALAAFLLRPLLRSKPAGSPGQAMLDRPERPPALAGARTEGAPAPAVANVVPEIDFAPAGTDGSDPVGRLKELMKSRKDESLQILSGWIEKREDAV